MMTNKIGGAAMSKVIDRLNGFGGINDVLAALEAGAGSASSPGFDPAQILPQNVPSDLAVRSGAVKYPSIQVYCEKILNQLTEKFRSFSGKVQMAVEIRHSQDRIDGLLDILEDYADAATAVLNGSRGDWGDGMFYSGGYEISFGPVKSGGRNFIQVAKVTFDIGVSRN
jgi:hypothetical protein